VAFYTFLSPLESERIIHFLKAAEYIAAQEAPNDIVIAA